MQENRLTYEIDQEFLMRTIANTENFSIAFYNQKYPFIHISLDSYNDTDILSLLQCGKHLIYSIRYRSILTKYRIEEVVEMIREI